MRLVSLFLCRCLCPWLAAPSSGPGAHSLPLPSLVLGVKDLGGLSFTQAFRGSREGSYTDATRLGVFTANPNSPIPLQHWRMNSDQGFCNTHPQRALGGYSPGLIGFVRTTTTITTTATPHAWVISYCRAELQKPGSGKKGYSAIGWLLAGEWAETPGWRGCRLRTASSS